MSADWILDSQVRVRSTSDLDVQRGYRFEGERSRLARQTEEFRARAAEAQAAFREKRDPVFERTACVDPMCSTFAS